MKHYLEIAKENFIRKIKKYWYYLLVICFVIGVDQLTKWIVATQMQKGQSIPFIKGLLQFTYIENPGMAWGLLADHPWVFQTLSAIGITVFLVYLFVKNEEQPFFDIGLTLVIGGGIGNMIDRLSTGLVVDFLDISPWFSFPIFNGADSFVCIGAAMMIVSLLYQLKDEIQKEKNSK